jgi:hypothetical protein
LQYLSRLKFKSGLVTLVRNKSNFDPLCGSVLLRKMCSLLRNEAAAPKNDEEKIETPQKEEQNQSPTFHVIILVTGLKVSKIATARGISFSVLAVRGRH